MASFAAERDWDRFHTPRNLMLALMGEVGELAEVFQWRGDAGCAPGLPAWSDSDKIHLGEELSDILLYLVRLSDRCGIDLAAASDRKMHLNRIKYPAHVSRGRSDKYTAYVTSATAEAPSTTSATRIPSPVSTQATAPDSPVGIVPLTWLLAGASAFAAAAIVSIFVSRRS